jgi:hypothetical protein
MKLPRGLNIFELRSMIEFTGCGDDTTTAAHAQPAGVGLQKVRHELRGAQMDTGNLCRNRQAALSASEWKTNSRKTMPGIGGRFRANSAGKARQC